nr:capsular polysaccharide export protein [uncultured bacterium]
MMLELIARGSVATRRGTRWRSMVVGGRASMAVLGGCVWVAVVSGCGAVRTPGVDRATTAPPHAAASSGDVMSEGDRAQLAALASARARTPLAEGYLIGTDDLLDVRIPDLLDTQAPSVARPAGASLTPVAGAPVFQQGLRVDARGEVSVPMLGAIRASGLTPAALERELARRLIAAGILRAPQVSVQVAEYRSRVVAVVGSVERPGLYPLTRPGATLSDLIWAAGGASKDAGRVVEFAPAAKAAAPAPRTATTTPTASAPRAASDETDHALANPLRLDLESLLHPPSAAGTRIDPQVRPGDVISIAPAGTVQVSGWVDKPGAYPVTHGLTIAGAVAAAGGHLFAADRHAVSVTRAVGPNEQRQFTVDLEAVAAGRAADVPITGGDVVHLPASTARVIPWGFWSVAREMVHVGGNVLLF